MPDTTPLNWGKEMAAWEQDGFTIVAKTEPDENMTLEESQEPPTDQDTEEFKAFYAKRKKEWEHDQWSFVGVVVTAGKYGVVLGDDSCWGIESDDQECIDEIARVCAGRAVAEAERKLAEIVKGEQG